MVQREMTQSDQIPPSYLYHSKSCAPFACLMVEEHHRWKKIVSGYGGVLILWRLLGQVIYLLKTGDTGQMGGGWVPKFLEKLFE